jgi:hypothetical protein
MKTAQQRHALVSPTPVAQSRSVSPLPQNFKGSKFGDDYSNELPAKILALTTVATPLLFIYLLVIS